MNWEEYKILSEKTLSSQFHHDEKTDLILHATMGILTEIEELLDNHMYESSDEINRSEEVADAWWYVAIIGRMYNLSIPSSVNSSMDEPMEIILNVIKRSLKMLDYLKKKLFYNKEIIDDLVVQNTTEIISLLLTYSSLYNIDVEKIWDINIEKLRARYGDKFSSDRAINRDLENERKILEG